jgi:hypothetical protein
MSWLGIGHFPSFLLLLVPTPSGKQDEYACDDQNESDNTNSNPQWEEHECTAVHCG